MTKPISSTWKITGPDDDGFVWLEVDYDHASSTINLGKVEEVREKLAEWLGDHLQQAGPLSSHAS